MIIGCVVEISFLGEVKLSNAVKRFVVKIFGQTVKQTQCLILTDRHSCDLLFNGKIHKIHLPSREIITKIIGERK